MSPLIQLINAPLKSVPCICIIIAFVVFPHAYLLTNATFYTTSRSCTPPVRAEARAAASPRHSWASSGARACTAWCTRRTAVPLRARTSGSSRSRAPSPDDSPPAPADTWTWPSDRTSGTARTTSRSRLWSAGEPPARRHSVAWSDSRLNCRVFDRNRNDYQLYLEANPYFVNGVSPKIRGMLHPQVPSSPKCFAHPMLAIHIKQSLCSPPALSLQPCSHR